MSANEQSTRTTVPIPVAGLDGTVLSLVENPARLVVFVHGFRGGATSSWGDFPELDSSEWWEHADLLFVGYESQRLDPLGVSNALRLLLARIYPELPEEFLFCEDAYVRDPDVGRYSELVLVGHSLGGLVARRAAVDIVRSWARSGGTAPIITDGRMCLFSPATAGFDPSGTIGTIRSLVGDRIFEILLRNPPALRDLRPQSRVLTSCQRLTEEQAKDHPHVRLLLPEIVWANPDEVVVASDYDTDLVSHSEVNVTHRSVCKPNPGYVLPRRVVEEGQLP